TAIAGGVCILTEKRYSVRFVIMVPLPIRCRICGGIAAQGPGSCNRSLAVREAERPPVSAIFAPRMPTAKLPEAPVLPLLSGSSCLRPAQLPDPAPLIKIDAGGRSA